MSHIVNNGLLMTPRAWQSIRNIAFASLVHARVGYEYLSFAFEHAWKIHACLPIKNLQKDGVPVSPYELFLVQNLAFVVSEFCSVRASSMLINAKIWTSGLSSTAETIPKERF